MKKILYITRDDGGCGFYRCMQPASFLKRMGVFDAQVVMRTPTAEQLLDADLVIMQEMGGANATSVSRFCIEHKIPYMTEMDDFLHHVSPHNDGGFSAWNPSTLYVHRSMEMMKAAFAAQVSTNQLAREYFPYNPTIFVVPNYLDKDRWENPTTKRGDGKIRIGWCGGNAHADDLLMVSKVLQKIVKESDGKVVFETIGMTRQELHGVFGMEDIQQECPSCGYEGQIHHFPGAPQNEFPALMASRGWDIAIAPVVDNGFGNCKSDLKIKEYAANGIPVIASPVVPYREAAADGASIAFATTWDEWYNALKDLINSQEKRDSMIDANRKWVGRYWIQDNAQRIQDIYKQIIERAELVLGKKEDRVRS